MTPHVLLSCHHCEFTHPGALGSDVLHHGDAETTCLGSGLPSKCFCPGVMRVGCPCSRCHGTGWYAQGSATSDGDYDELYCECGDGDALRIRERREKQK